MVENLNFRGGGTTHVAIESILSFDSAWETASNVFIELLHNSCMMSWQTCVRIYRIPIRLDVCGSTLKFMKSSYHTHFTILRAFFS